MKQWNVQYKIFLLSVLLTISLHCEGIAQKELITFADTVKLETVNILSHRTLETKGFKTTTLDSGVLQQEIGNSLGSVISRHTPVFVKQYGAGGVNSISIRGAGASHTRVLWNGLSLNSPMLGQLDFNSVPIYFIDELTLHHSGNALSQSRGSLGGSLNLSNSTTWEERQDILLRQEAGNFYTANSYASLRLGNSRFQSQTGVLYQHSNTRSAFEVTGRASRIERFGGMQEFYYRKNESNVFSAKIWLQQNNTRTRRSEFSNERIKQQFIRAVADWKHYRGRQMWLTKTGAVVDNYFYRNPGSDVLSRNFTRQLYFSETYTNRLTSAIKLQAGLNMEWQYARSNNYAHQAKRMLTSIYAGFNYKPLPCLSGYVLMKQGLTDKQFTPFVPSMGITYQPVTDRQLFLKANLSGNFRRPSLNAIYWQPGGNPDLSPEKGISGETGIEYRFHARNNWRFTTEHTYFWSRINEWILWMPGNRSYWLAHNVKNVRSQGYEAKATLQTPNKPVKLRLTLGYSYTSTTNQTRINEWDQSKGKQLIYVPLHNANATAELNFKGYSLMLTQSITGKRYTTRDNSTALPAYYLANAHLRKTFRLSRFSLGTSLQVENIFNHRHEVVKGYPLAGRKVKLAITFKMQ